MNVFATVHDKSSGKTVKDLTKDNFTLEEEGREQTIKYVEAETSLPLHLGLMVDTSLSQARVLGDERSAGIKFFDQILRENDQAFVIHFDREIELLQDFTSSKDKLDKALNLLEPPRLNSSRRSRKAEIIRRAAGILAVVDDVIRSKTATMAAPSCTTRSCLLRKI